MPSPLPELKPSLARPPPATECAAGRRPARRVRFSPLLVLFALAGQALSGVVAAGGTMALSMRAGLAPERALAIAGTLALGVALAAGFACAALSRRIGFREFLVAGVAFTAGSTWALARLLLAPFGLYRPEWADIAYLANLLGNPLGGVVLAAVVIAGASFVGSSLGYLLAGSGRLEMSFGYEAFIARSHLRLRKGSATRLMTLISIGGVAVGVLALTVVLSVMSGFEADLKSKIVGTNAHAVVLKYGTDFSEWRDTASLVRRVKGVTGVTPFVVNEVMVSSDQNLAGALIKGIDPATVSQVTRLQENMTEGRLEWLDAPESIPQSPLRRGRVPALGGRDQGAPSPGAKQEGLTEEDILRPRQAAPAEPEPALPGIVLGAELAHSLKVAVGDRVNVVSPLGGELGPTGPVPKSRPFRVAGLFYSGMYEYDAKLAYIAIPEAQRFFGLGDSVTGLELKTNDLDNTRQITRAVLEALDGYPYRTKDWGEMNKNLFSALRLEKLVMAVILAFIVLVACFNIISTLIMMVLEKGKEIAILKSMGSTDTSVMKVFVLEGLFIGAVGTAVGLVLGYITCLLVEVVGIRLDAEVYYIDKLPVRIEALQFAAVAAIAVLLSYLATIYPALRASRLPPVDGLRNE